MVLVDPAERGRGVGRALLDHAIALAGEGQALRLDATPAGRLLYSTMGFRDDFGLARYRRERPAHGNVSSRRATAARSGLGRNPSARPTSLRRRSTGDARILLASAPDLAWVVRSETGLEGYALGRHGHDTDHVGPIVASEPDTATALASASLNRIANRPASIDVPDDQTTFGSWIRSRASCSSVRSRA